MNIEENDFVEKMIHANTWWRVKTMFEEEWLGKKREHGLEHDWEVK